MVGTNREGIELQRSFDGRKAGLLTAYEILCSLNIAWAFGNALFVYALRSLAVMSPQSDAAYYFRRSAVRINDLLRLSPINEVSIERVARQTTSQWGQVGEELTYFVSIIGTAVFVFLLFRLNARRFACHAFLTRMAGAVVLFAAPACYLLVEKLTWGWEYGEVLPNSYWQSLHVAVFGGEILCFLILLMVGRKRSFSAWALGVILALHYMYWVSALWPRDLAMYPYRFFSPYLLVLVFPMSGFVWMLYAKARKAGAVGSPTGRRAGKWTVVTAIIAVLALALIWLPPRGHNLAHPADLRSLTIQLLRGPCYGMCPRYTMTIHGNGLVEFVGKRFTKIAGSQTEMISNEQVATILQQLDRAHFFALEDRAFVWCFDTSSVAISVSADGRSKSVVSDAGCVGWKSGQQAQFVRAANEIDTIVGSERWVRCDNANCWK